MRNITDKYWNLYSIVQGLKFTKRQGWLGRKLDSDTIASHVYGSMVLGWIIANEENADKDRVIKMLMVHDFVMAKMEDISPTKGKHAGKYESKEKMEKQTNVLIKKIVPVKIAKEYSELFEEYNKKETSEAIIANEANKLETLLQGEEYEKQTGRTDILDEFLETYSGIFQTKTGSEIFRQIKLRHKEREKYG